MGQLILKKISHLHPRTQIGYYIYNIVFNPLWNVGRTLYIQSGQKLFLEENIVKNIVLFGFQQIWVVLGLPGEDMTMQNHFCSS